MKEDNFDEFFRNKVRELNAVPPQLPWDKDDLWNDIEGELTFKRKASPLKYTLRIAATVSLLVVAWFFYNRDSMNVTVTYKEELLYEENDPVRFSEVLSEEDVLSRIMEKCQIKTTLCETREFKELSNQLEDLNMKAEEIQRELQLFGSTPNAVKAQIRIENLKADIIKALIKI